MSRPPTSFLSVHYCSFGQRFHLEIYLGFQECSTFRLVPSICFSLQYSSLLPQVGVPGAPSPNTPGHKNPYRTKSLYLSKCSYHTTQPPPGAAQVSHQPLLLPMARSAVSSHLWRQGADTRLSHRAAGPDMVGGPFPRSPARLLCRHWRLASLSEWGQLHKSRGAIILLSIVMNTLACHVGDCGSVPRWDNLLFFFFFGNPGAFKPWPHTPGPELCPALHALCSCFQSAKKNAHSALD